MTKFDKLIKRIFDLLVSLIGLILFGWLIVVSAIIARIDTGLSGFFKQIRVGQNGKLFKIYKIRSMKNVNGVITTVSTNMDPRITKFGAFCRKTKIDELPQLINVLKGEMSFVGPRPDVPGFADMLKGENKIILTIKPGITGPASVYFKNEEEILSKQKHPEQYSREVIWPEKVRLNKYYIEHYSLWLDFKILFKTVFGGTVSV